MSKPLAISNPLAALLTHHHQQATLHTNQQILSEGVFDFAQSDVWCIVDECRVVKLVNQPALTVLICVDVLCLLVTAAARHVASQ